MSQHPLETVLAVAAAGGAWTVCGGTITARRVDVVETPPQTAGAQGAYAPQGLQYQLWDSNLNNGAGGWGTTKQLLPGAILSVQEPIPQGRARGPVVGMPAQTNPGGQTTAKITPVRVMSGTATTTQVLVREYD